VASCAEVKALAGAPTRSSTPGISPRSERQKWLREVERIFAEGHMPIPATDDSTPLAGGPESGRYLTATKALARTRS